jgi:photosystem II stability/assembly factor-like uncharacterized protein
MYRAPDTNGEFILEQTLASSDIGHQGDLNAGIIAEDTQGRLYATGHSNPCWWKWNISDKIKQKFSWSNPLEKRTNVIHMSQDDGRTWKVLRDETDLSADDCPHPHNVFFDDETGQLWWLVGHDGTRLQTYNPMAERWTDRYHGTAIEEDDRLPLTMTRANGRLWLCCEVSGSDAKQLYVSLDNGDSWTKINHSFTYPPDSNNDGLWAIDTYKPRDDEYIYIAGGRINSGQSFVKRSRNNGESWELIYTGAQNSDAWITTTRHGLFVSDGPSVYRSTDGKNFNKWFSLEEDNLSPKEFVEPGIKSFGKDTFLVGKSTLYEVEFKYDQTGIEHS